MTVVEYAAKFEELVKFYPHYNSVAIVNASNLRAAYTLRASKRLNEEKGKIQNCGKLYSAPADNGKQKVSYAKRQSGRETPASVKCFKCGKPDHHANECKNNVLRCFKCGNTSHCVAECMNDGPTCFSCGEVGHSSTNCHKPKKAQSREKMFPLSGTKTTSTDRLIRGMRYINGILLIVIIDTGATYSFISLDYVERLNLKLSSMNGSMIVDTLALGPITTSWVCLNSPLTIYDKNFGMDLVCRRITKQVGESLINGAGVFMILASMKVESKVVIDELSMICEFPKVFPYDICDLPPKHEIEYAIDLVPSTSPLSMAPYRMSALMLSKLMKQLEDLLEKKFV
ncbi:uncharacterized protein LOC131648959 [Vicia villosa]|uniref:uncharacterized protein LOC131648959 n=1 Tax=Vicia villosa TaxID=3911 RepID=UPI00273C4E67|nr:uncharacterized protein LOC131648959 [Vicia villosa]